MTNSYSIQDLCDQTGLPRRTIHFYTQQGLLPPPEGAGLGAHYSENHLLRLQAIPRLRSQGLRLDQIREKLNQMPQDDLKKLLSQISTNASPPPASAGLQSFVHFPLGSGIVIIAPTKLSPAEKRKFDQLLQEAQRIFHNPVHHLDKE